MKTSSFSTTHSIHISHELSVGTGEEVKSDGEGVARVASLCPEEPEGCDGREDEGEEDESDGCESAVVTRGAAKHAREVVHAVEDRVQVSVVV